jgi:hypothetical protein
MTTGSTQSDEPGQRGNALSPGVMLAASMHALPGVYAVLLGSGVSTGAGNLLQADLRDIFLDFIPNEDAYKEYFHNYEYRLGLAQEKTQHVNGAYRAAAGEYVGERAWTYDDDRIPLVEVAFRKSRELSAEWPWDVLLDGEFDAECWRLIVRFLKRWASRW